MQVAVAFAGPERLCAEDARMGVDVHDADTGMQHVNCKQRGNENSGDPTRAERGPGLLRMVFGWSGDPFRNGVTGSIPVRVANSLFRVHRTNVFLTRRDISM